MLGESGDATTCRTGSPQPPDRTTPAACTGAVRLAGRRWIDASVPARGRGARPNGSATDPAPAHRQRPHRCGPAASGRPQPPRSVGVLAAGPGTDGEPVVPGAANPRSAGLPVAAAERLGTVR